MPLIEAVRARAGDRPLGVGEVVTAAALGEEVTEVPLACAEDLFCNLIRKNRFTTPGKYLSQNRGLETQTVFCSGNLTPPLARRIFAIQKPFRAPQILVRSHWPMWIVAKSFFLAAWPSGAAVDRKVSVAVLASRRQSLPLPSV